MNRRRSGVVHALFVMLAIGVLWISMSSNSTLAFEQAAATRRLLDREQAALALDSAARIVSRRRAAGLPVDQLDLAVEGWGHVVVSVDAAGRVQLIAAGAVGTVVERIY